MQTTENFLETIKRLLVLITLIGVAFLLFSAVKHQTIVLANDNFSQPENVTASPQSFAVSDESNNSMPATLTENACASCHEEVVRGFAKSVHGKSWNYKVQDGSESCQSCHGDGMEHIANGGDKTKIKNPAKMKASEASQTCLTCHSQVGNHATWRGSKHESAGLSCLNCHSAHHSPIAQSSELRMFANLQSETKLLKMRTEKDTCYQCHNDIRKSEFQRSTHLFRNEDRESRMDCSSCHDAHGAFGEKLMKTASVNETCYTCHTEKRGPFLWEHSPARESCASCHKAHGSNHTALLKARAPMLCQQCHIQGRHQTVAGKPNSVFMISRGCLNCHPQIHGSNHPSGINLQR